MTEKNLRIVNMLDILQRAYIDGVIPSIIDDGDHDDRIEQIDKLIAEINAESNTESNQKPRRSISTDNSF